MRAPGNAAMALGPAPRSMTRRALAPAGASWTLGPVGRIICRLGSFGCSMLRISAIFIVICMVLIAGACGAVLYLGVRAERRRNRPSSAVAVLTALALYNAVTTGCATAPTSATRSPTCRAAPPTCPGRWPSSAAGSPTLEGQGSSAAETARAVTAPITAELERTRHAGQAARRNRRGARHRRSPPARSPLPRPDRREAPDNTAALDLGAAERRPRLKAPRRLSRDREDTLAAIRSAIDAHRVDLYLQPIVTLPQRKVRYYEALTRLRTEDGDMLPPTEFLEPAEAGGLIAADRPPAAVPLRAGGAPAAAQEPRDRPVLQHLGDHAERPAVFPADAAVHGRQPGAGAVAGARIQAERVARHGPARARRASPRCANSASASAWTRSPTCGSSRAISPSAASATSRCRPRCCSARRRSRPDIHAADLSDLLGRYGISLIAERIETENQVVDLLDYDVRFGQGFLFSPPRPVRAEALAGRGRARRSRRSRRRRQAAGCGASDAPTASVSRRNARIIHRL